MAPPPVPVTEAASGAAGPQARPCQESAIDGRSHSDVAVGRIVWSTTASSSADRLSRSTLVAEARAEPLDSPGRVVLTPVEAQVDRLLDAATGRLEQGGNGQGRRGHGPARRPPADPAGQLSQGKDQPGVDGTEQQGEHPVDQGPVDQPVDVPQPEPEDADAQPGQLQGRPQELEVGPVGRHLGEHAERDAGAG
jgi:hypothetical protein